MIGVGSLSTPLPFSALPAVNIQEASPKAISGRTSYIRVRLEFLRYPQVIRQLFNGTSRTLHPRFPCGSAPSVLNLATHINSPDRSTKSTTSHLNVLCVLVNIRFQVLFHSPPGVLFTFPSQYCFSIGHQVVFRLGGWAPRLPCRFLVPARTLDSACILWISPTGLSPCLVGLPMPLGYPPIFLIAVLNPEYIATFGLASSAFARRYSQNLF